MASPHGAHGGAELNYSRNIRQQALLYDYIKKPQHYDDSSPPEDMWRGRLAGEMLLHSRSDQSACAGKTLYNLS